MIEEQLTTMQKDRPPLDGGMVAAPPPECPRTEITFIRPSAGWHVLSLGELWRYRELVLMLAWRDVKVRYKQTVLGAAWAILQPALTMVVFTLFFARASGAAPDGVAYPLFVYAGLLPWMFLSTAVSGASQSLISQQALLTKIYLPRLFVPAASVGGGRPGGRLAPR